MEVLMSRVKEVFSEIIMLEPGKRVLIKVDTANQLASIRTMLHRERKAYEAATGRDVPMVCSAKEEADGSYLEVKLEPLSYKVVEDSPDA
jgi:hypothetical protein